MSDIDKLAQVLRDAIAASDVRGQDVAWALTRVMREQPCGYESSFGMVGQFKDYGCVRLWHMDRDIRHSYVLRDDVRNGCREPVENPAYEGGGLRLCARQLVDGVCPAHPTA
ncbi:hypothetical protein Rhe02_54430 [Rhizocola hellebori]|uniref:Uncharacterized protein n=1 Tax=Rhizocola hellebori TaxID=1392758 RepID=A0A8J3VIS9_9ACTN|nr:hypothetical protein [Rhizocola hellebori]GIH07376.1 hypothetical protein Rhe02_54430 [Rhizocola hellebori]